MAEYIFEMSDALYDEATGQMCMKPEYKGKLTRCKDCFKRSTALCPFQLAKFGWHCDTDYCSRAERKEK